VFRFTGQVTGVAMNFDIGSAAVAQMLWQGHYPPVKLSDRSSWAAGIDSVPGNHCRAYLASAMASARIPLWVGNKLIG